MALSDVGKLKVRADYRSRKKTVGEQHPDLLTLKSPGEVTDSEGNSAVRQRVPGGLTEEEERELDELLNDDD